MWLGFQAALVLQLANISLKTGRRSFGMWTFPEQLTLATMALAANLANFLRSWWRRAMAAMARDTGRRTQVALLEHHVRVVAGFVLGDDVGRQLVFLHQLRVPMAATAGLRDVGRIHVGLGRFDFEDVMDAMAIDADSDLLVAMLE